MGKIRKPEVHPSLLAELNKITPFQEELNNARKQILENTIQINILQSAIDFGVQGAYFTDDLSDITGTPIETGVFDSNIKRFMMP